MRINLLTANTAMTSRASRKRAKKQAEATQEAKEAQRARAALKARGIWDPREVATPRKELKDIKVQHDPICYFDYVDKKTFTPRGISEEYYNELYKRLGNKEEYQKIRKALNNYKNANDKPMSDTNKRIYAQKINLHNYDFFMKLSGNEDEDEDKNKYIDIDLDNCIIPSCILDAVDEDNTKMALTLMEAYPLVNNKLQYARDVANLLDKAKFDEDDRDYSENLTYPIDINLKNAEFVAILLKAISLVENKQACSYDICRMAERTTEMYNW